MTITKALPFGSLLFSAALAAAAPSFAMGNAPTTVTTTPVPANTEQKKSEFGGKDPIGQSPADKGRASGDSGSGSDAEVGAVGNDAAILGADKGTSSNMGGGMEPGAPSGESGGPAQPGGGSR